MSNKSKYKKLTDLYTDGRAIVFDDGTVMWLQVMNPFEVDDARKQAQAGRGRITNALKAVGSQEYDAVMGTFLARGRDKAIIDLVNAKSIQWYMDVQQAIEVDPDWKERMEIITRSSDDNLALSMELAEKEYLAQINNEWLAELDKRLQEEQQYNQGRWSRMSDEDLVEEFREVYLDRRANDMAVAEYNLTEMFYGCRECEAVPGEDGTFARDAHAGCNHKLRVWDSKEEVRDLPDDLINQIRSGFDDLTMTARDARFSRRQGSSSDSSPLPSVAAESTASTPTATPETPPGISSPQ